jgi:formate hydrogenlyase transcriptional activator
MRLAAVSSAGNLVFYTVVRLQRATPSAERNVAAVYKRGASEKYRARRAAMNSTNLIGSSRVFKNVLDEISVVAPTDSSVLIEGETGTGKEVVARAIHDKGPRRNHPFVALNCAAIPSALLESELFGHEKGAFTGAIAQTLGRFHAANGGTLFLDEVGEMPLELQPKLLRVLQEQQFERLGSARTMRVDVRIIAATNANLREMVDKKLFRADLFYRLNVFPLTLPPLRERREDIPQLVLHFMRVYSTRFNKSVEYVSRATLDALCSYHWPGNIRELQNFVERSMITSQGDELTPRNAELDMLTRPAPENYSQSLSDAERAHIVRVLDETLWVVGGRNGAAARLGLPRTTLISRMQKLGLTRALRMPASQDDSYGSTLVSSGNAMAFAGIGD